MVAELAPGATLGRVRRLGGGLAPATFTFDLQGARNGGYVVKRYRADDVVGEDPVDLPVFDLICGLRARQWGAVWLTAYREQGLTDTTRQFAARATSYLRQALAELSA